MRRYILLSSVIILLLNSCKKQEVVKRYDTDYSFIYFEKPVFNLGNTVDDPDSLRFSFAYEADTLDEKMLAFPMRLIGQKKAYDRMIGFRIVSDKTTVPSRLIQVVPPRMRSGSFRDTLYIRVKRDPILRDASYQLVGELYQNGVFGVGEAAATRFSLAITDQLTEPAWWADWSPFFGEYHKEVYKKWIEIYYPGVDLTPPVMPEDKPNYAWNNMPNYVHWNYYPLTLFYIDQLRKYFIEHEVYPDGDRSKPRIYLP